MISEIRVKFLHSCVTSGCHTGSVIGQMFCAKARFRQEYEVPAWLVVVGNPVCVWKYCCVLKCEQCMALAVSALSCVLNV